MIKKFFDNKIGSLALVIIVLLIIRIPVFLLLPKVSTESVNSGILSSFLNQINASPIFSFSLSFIVLLIGGLLINKLCWDYNVVEKPGYIVLYFFGILNSCFLDNFYITNIQFGNLFVLFGINYLYIFIKNNYNRRWLFMSALMFGLAALCIPEHFWVIIFLIAIVVLFKPILPVDIFAIVFGLLMPYYVVSSIGYLFSFKFDFYNSWQFWVIKNKVIDFHWLKNGPEIFLIIAMLVFIFVGVLKVIGSYFRSNVDTRRSKLAMLVFGIYVTAIFFLRFKDYGHYFIIASVPASVFISTFYEGKSWKKWKELLNILTLLFLVYTLFRNAII